MYITKRDLNLFSWINGHGFGHVMQIAHFMGVKFKTSYARVKKLTDAGYLHKERVLHSRFFVFRPTQQAVIASCDSLAAPSKISPGSYQHDSRLIDLDLHIHDQYGVFMTPERRLKHEFGIEGVGSYGHCPDGIIEIEGRKIAVELELTVKAKARLDKIMTEYASNLDIREVWYFVDGEAVANAVQKAAERASAPHIKITILDEGGFTDE